MHPWKLGIKQIKSIKKNCCKGVSSTPLLRTQTLKMGQNAAKIAFFDFYCLLWFALFNRFHATDLFWYPLKTSENLWFSAVFRGYQKRLVARNGLRCLIFLKSPWWQVWTLCAQDLKGTVWNSIICVSLSVKLFSMNFSVAAFVSECLWLRILESSPKLSKIVVVMKHF